VEPTPTQTETQAASGRVFTLANLISFARLLGVPVFLYLFLVPHADAAAIVVLAIGGTSDWVDGYVARRMGQVSRVGQLLDPLADRLYILATLLAFTARQLLPWPVTAVLLLREAMLAVCLVVLRRYGYGAPPVHYLGKTATFTLLAAFPVILLAAWSPAAAPVAYPVGWALMLWGIVLYWAAGILYVLQVVSLVKLARRARAVSP
jgi:cardiolipin synthase